MDASGAHCRGGWEFRLQFLNIIFLFLLTVVKKLPYLMVWVKREFALSVFLRFID